MAAARLSLLALAAFVLFVISPVTASRRVLFYDTNPGEGFSMRRLALLRNLLLVRAGPLSRSC